MFTVLISGLPAVSLRLNKSPFCHAAANMGKQEDGVSVWDERAYARMYVKNAKKNESGEIEKKKSILEASCFISAMTMCISGK